MKDASTTPRSYKKYSVTGDELKQALGIDWPGRILDVSKDYQVYDGFTVTMLTQPHELSGEQRDRFTRDVAIPVPAQDPVPPAKPKPKRRWRG